MPVNEQEIENISKLEPFSQLLDHLAVTVTPGNPEMIPQMDLSEEATREFYEMEDFMYGKERWEKERIDMNYQRT